MPSTESILLYILALGCIFVFLIFTYLFILAEAEWRFRDWASQLHACHCWKRDYLDHYQELEINDGIIETDDGDNGDEGLDIDEIFLAEWRAESAAKSYFIGLEHLDKARERLYSPIVFPMLIWQVLLPWGSIRLPHRSFFC